MIDCERKVVRKVVNLRGRVNREKIRRKENRCQHFSLLARRFAGTYVRCWGLEMRASPTSRVAIKLLFLPLLCLFPLSDTVARYKSWWKLNQQRQSKSSATPSCIEKSHMIHSTVKCVLVSPPPYICLLAYLFVGMIYSGSCASLIVFHFSFFSPNYLVW